MSCVHFHLPFYQLKEKKRIEDNGGFVSLNGVWRVQGVLATSRALGDYPLKDKNVLTAEPDVLTFRIDPAVHDFALLASDGLWDALSNEEAVAFVVRAAAAGRDYQEIARALAEEAHGKESTDNITVMILDLKEMCA